MTKETPNIGCTPNFKKGLPIRFADKQTAERAAQIIDELREDLFDSRAAWLMENGAKESDVYTDEDGAEYIDLNDEEDTVLAIPESLSLAAIRFAF